MPRRGGLTITRSGAGALSANSGASPAANRTPVRPRAAALRVALAIASLVVRDFYVPYWKPTPERELKMTRVFSIVIAIVPLVFVFFIPEILKLSFFTRARRLSITIVVMMGFYLPLFASNRGATAGLIGAAISTTVWYLLGNPYGIDNMYIAAATPLVVMAIERLVLGAPSGRPATPASSANTLAERTTA